MLTSLIGYAACFVVGIILGNIAHSVFVEPVEDVELVTATKEDELESFKKEALELKADLETTIEEMNFDNSVAEMTITALKKENRELNENLSKSIPVSDILALMSKYGASLMTTAKAYDTLKAEINKLSQNASKLDV